MFDIVVIVGYKNVSMVFIAGYYYLDGYNLFW